MIRADYPFPLVLGSGSPRRKELLEQLGYSFEIRTSDIDETPPDGLIGKEIAEFLASEKSEHIKTKPNEVLITADTVVWNQGVSLAKPANKEEAMDMLTALSGGKHEVITGVCIRQGNHKVVFSDTTIVHFNSLQLEDINQYIDQYQPFDKAGAYGIQEWIGMIGIERIEGSYFNVVGLPVEKLDRTLKTFLEKK